MRLKISILFCLSALISRVFSAEQTATVTESKINVRGQPSLVGEVVTQLQKGDTVTVLEEIKLDQPKPGEPTNWAKIKLPANTPVWIFSSMVKDGSVSVSRLNMRAGPGENYSVVGRLERGDAVKPIRTVENWTEIEAPAAAYAFVDSSLIKITGESPASAPAVAAAPVAPVTQAAKGTQTITQPATNAATPPTVQGKPAELQVATAARATATPTVQQPTLSSELEPPTAKPQVTRTVPQQTVTTSQPPAPVANPPAVSASPAATLNNPATPAAVASLPATLPKVAQAPAQTTAESSTKRVVRREGIIRATRSIQAPTWYELIHPETKKTIDFLNAEMIDLKLKEYKGKKVVVTGEEAVDPRWPNTPILEMETLDMAP